MKLKTFGLGVATAALIATGAAAQNSTNTDTMNKPSTPPAAETATPPSATMKSTETDTTASTKINANKPAGAVEFSSSMSADEMLASKVTGMTVYNSAGEELGDINDIVVDNTGKPSVFIVGVGGFLGIGEKDVGVPFDNLTFALNESNERVARLDASKEALESAPNFVYKDGDAAATPVKTN